MIYLSALVLSMFTTIALVPILRDLAGKYLALDLPGGRKIHNRPTPKSGGIAMILGAVAPILLWAPGGSFIVSILIGSWIIIVFGVIDDMKDLPYGIKFIGQISAALVVVFYGGVKIKYLGDLVPEMDHLADMAAVPLTIFVIVGVTNAINLSDGLDGLAGGISLLGFMCIGYLAFIGGDKGVVLVCSTMIGAILGFLRYNTHPASIFMGDTGSQLLGFLIITLSLSLTQKNIGIAPVLPLIIMGLPIMDTLRVIGDRMMEGKMPFKADTRHLHHRLMKLGFHHSETVFTIYCLHSALMTFAFVFRYNSDWFLLLMYMVFSLAIILGLSCADKYGWHLRNSGYANGIIKPRSRWTDDNRAIIKIFFKLLEIAAPFLLFATCVIPSTIPPFVGLSAGIFGAILVAVRILKPEWTGFALKLAIYIQVPIFIYQSEINPATWVNLHLLRGYNILFAMIAIVVVIVLKLTRRTEGFKSSPTDFLILFVALVIPNIPDPHIRSYQIGIIAAKIISLYYGYEVLIGELRGNYMRLPHTTILTLSLVCGRGIIGL